MDLDTNGHPCPRDRTLLKCCTYPHTSQRCPRTPQNLWGYQSVKIHQLTVLMGPEEVMHVDLETQSPLLKVPQSSTTKLEQAEVKCWVQTRMQTRNPLPMQKCPESFTQALPLDRWSMTPPLQCGHWKPVTTCTHLRGTQPNYTTVRACLNPPHTHTHTSPLPHLLSCRNILKPSKQCIRYCIWGGLLLRY